uniref:Uncharacterized protein n=1 Tax=Sphaerodactylus townsendi TaxID=933632 RepID=A0ACB8F088_9SAUR
MFVPEEKIFAAQVLRLRICALDGAEWLEEVAEDTAVERLKERCCLKHVGGWAGPSTRGSASQPRAPPPGFGSRGREAAAMFVPEEKIFAAQVLRLRICALDGAEWLEEVAEDTAVERLKERCCLKHLCVWGGNPIPSPDKAIFPHLTASVVSNEEVALTLPLTRTVPSTALANHIAASAGFLTGAEASNAPRRQSEEKVFCKGSMLPRPPGPVVGRAAPLHPLPPGCRHLIPAAGGGWHSSGCGILQGREKFHSCWPLSSPDGSQGVTVRRRRGLDYYRDSRTVGFGSATWATAPLAGNVSVAGRPSEGADSSEAKAWRMLRALEEAWDSEREEYCQALHQMEQSMGHLRAALVPAAKWPGSCSPVIPSSTTGDNPATPF